ncbi:hypothetical protein HDE_00789 [Halotydeus destructor]|nr:hypothetical protein HDE_00789 [Halotydeus destructor]
MHAKMNRIKLMVLALHCATFSSVSTDQLTSEEYDACDKGSMKACFAFGDNSCISTRNCSMLLSREIFSMDRQTKLKMNGNVQSLIDPDVVVLRVVQSADKLARTQIGIELTKDKEQLICSETGEAIACDKCTLVNATQIKGGCQFSFPVNALKKGSEGNIAIAARLHVNAEDTGIEVGNYDSYDYMGQDCYTNSTTRQVLCSKNHLHLTKAIMDKTNLRIYTDSIGKPSFAPVVIMDNGNNTKLLLCFPEDEDFPKMVKMSSDSKTKASDLDGVSTYNSVFYFRLSQNVRRILYEMDIDKLNQQTKMNFRNDNFKIETWAVYRTSFCQSDLDDNELNQFSDDSANSTIKRVGTIQAKFSFPAYEIVQSQEAGSNSNMLTIVIVVLIMIAITAGVVFAFSRKRGTNGKKSSPNIPSKAIHSNL